MNDILSLYMLAGIGWIFLSVVVAAGIGSLRSIGWGGSLIFCLLFSPAIGLIATLLYPTKEDVLMQKNMFKLQKQMAENISVMAAERLNPLSNPG